MGHDVREFELPPELVELVRVKAAKLGMSPGDYTRKLIEKEILSDKKKKKAETNGNGHGLS